MRSIFPNPLHSGTPVTFDAYELQEVGEYVDGHGRPFIEPIFSEGTNPIKRFWTIYGHTEGEGVMALVDVDTEKDGIEVLRRMGVVK